MMNVLHVKNRLQGIRALGGAVASAALIVVIAISWPFGGVSLAQASPPGSTVLLGQLQIPGSVFITDVWGYVDSTANREYALVGDWGAGKGFYVVDVTHPSNPFLAANVTDAPGFDVKVWRQYAYCVTGSAGTGAIVDMSDPLAPQRVGFFPSSHNITVDPRGYLYLEGGSGQGLRIYDLNPNPIEPTFVWSDGVNDGHDATLVGNRLYDFHGSQFTRIYDVSDPTNPVVLGTIQDPAIRFHHSGYPTEDGKYLFICDELAFHPVPDITVWNIEDPAKPFKVGGFGDPSATVHNLYIIGNYAYLSYYTAGFRVLDISNPAGPVLVGEFDTSDWTGEVLRGAFGVYPFAPSGSIYVSDIENGLFVFSFIPPPTAVLIRSFRARYAGGGVRLDWELGAADGLEGFHVYRSDHEEADFERRNPFLLPPSAAGSFTDRQLESGNTYWYRLGAVDRDGEYFSPAVSVNIPYSPPILYQNYPNPFSPATTIAYSLGAASFVNLVIYDVNGKIVRTLVDAVRAAGPHSVDWDGRDDGGRPVASAVYFCRLSVDGTSVTRRMALLK